MVKKNLYYTVELEFFVIQARTKGINNIKIMLVLHKSNSSSKQSNS